MLCLFDVNVRASPLSLRSVEFIDRTSLYVKWKYSRDFLKFTDKDKTVKRKLCAEEIHNRVGQVKLYVFV